MIEGSSSKKREYLFPMQKYDFAISKQTSGVQEENSVQKSAPRSRVRNSRKVREQNDGIVWICQRNQSVELRGELHSNLSSLRRNERSLIH